MKALKIGILAFHGDVSEHVEALRDAEALRGTEARKNFPLSIVYVRTKADLKDLDGLIISGGESTTMQKLCEREGMWEDMKKIKAIFGTCAGAILLAKKVGNKAAGQKTLGLMDIEMERNAYGRQDESFEEKIQTTLGPMAAVFIRAPQIKSVGKGITVLSKKGGNPIACERESKSNYYLATCFHPELSSSLFHQYFLKQLQRFD